VFQQEDGTYDAFVEECRSLFYLHRGYLYHKVTRGKTVKEGTPVINPDVNLKGYKQVRVYGRPERYHRVVWAVAYGEVPDVIDHIDGDIHNNCLSNLRSVTSEINQRNQKLSCLNISGRTGVHRNKRTGKYEAYIGIGKGKRKHLGHFSSFEEAFHARREAESDLLYNIWRN